MKAKSWESRVQDKGLLEELVVFAREIRGKTERAFTLEELRTVTELAIHLDEGA